MKSAILYAIPLRPILREDYGHALARLQGLTAQLARIVADGIEQGEFAAADPAAAARAVFDATARFHNPIHASEWSDPRIDAAFGGVWALVLAGLTARKPVG